MAKYASTTTVSVEKSRAEIEKILVRYGASGFFSGYTNEEALVGFRIADRIVKITMTMPDRKADEFHWGGRYGSTQLSDQAAHNRWEQACRQRWRSLALIIKAKLEAVECGISTVEREFLADIVMPNGQSFGEWAGPQIENMYKEGGMPPLLGDGR